MAFDTSIDAEAIMNATPDQLKSWFWRVCHLYTIADQNGKVVPFRPNMAQRRFMKDIDGHGRHIILKARQLGFTTLIQIIILDSAMFIPNTNCGVIAHNLDDAENFFREKLKEVYERLPTSLRSQFPLEKCEGKQIQFAHKSKIRVGTSLRSGTNQILHVSEMGKIAAKEPEKAREIKTGAFNTVHQGQYIFVESTAEGQDGLFYDMCMKALERKKLGIEPEGEEFKLHFFPWYEDPKYALKSKRPITKKTQTYFKALSNVTGVKFTRDQMSWYQQKAAQQGKDMKREFPSTPEEAFEASVEGAIFQEEIERVYEQQRIGHYPFEQALGPVYGFWDIGRNDLMVIWLGQQEAPGQWRFFKVIADQGKSIPHYVDILQEMKVEGRWNWGAMVLPHDGNNTDVSALMSRAEMLRELMRCEVEVVPRTKSVTHDIEMVRPFLEKTFFDAEGAGPGVKMLQNYKWKRDERLGVWTDKPEHNDASHYADAFRTACGM